MDSNFKDQLKVSSENLSYMVLIKALLCMILYTIFSIGSIIVFFLCTLIPVIVFFEIIGYSWINDVIFLFSDYFLICILLCVFDIIFGKKILNYYLNVRDQILNFDK